MEHARHLSIEAKKRKRRRRQISWSVVAYAVAVVLVRHYFGIDLSVL